MANDLTGNPLRVDTAATIITTHTEILAMQWIDNNAAGGIIADTETLVMTIDGTVLTIYCADISQVSPMPWSISFSVPYGVHKLVVDTIDGGSLLIWKA